MSNLREDVMTGCGRRSLRRRALLPPRLRVLVVDREPLLLWALTNALEACGHRVVTAATADAALHALTRGHFDGALVDCQMADGRDLTVLDSIRTIAPGLPVVGMTARPGEETRCRACGHGAGWILEKPFDVFSLDRVLRSVCPAVASS